MWSVGICVEGRVDCGGKKRGGKREEGEVTYCGTNDVIFSSRAYSVIHTTYLPSISTISIIELLLLLLVTAWSCTSCGLCMMHSADLEDLERKSGGSVATLSIYSNF